MSNSKGMGLNVVLFVAGVALLATCTIYTPDLFGWNSQPVPPGYHVQSLGIIGGGRLIAISILFMITVSDILQPRSARQDDRAK